MQEIILRRRTACSRLLLYIMIASIASVFIGLYTMSYPALANPATGSTERVSLSATGEQGNASSGGNRSLSVSLDGRLIAFASYSNNLVAGDTNWLLDVFVRDRKTGKTELVSISSDGMQANGISAEASLSSDGRFVAFWSAASNLVPNDTNGQGDIFIRDRQTGTTERVSVSSSGDQGNGLCSSVRLSADGRYAVFVSASDNLVDGDTNGQADVFVHDCRLKTTQLVSVSSEGMQANGRSSSPSISADGSVVAFSSSASNLAVGDTNNCQDVFVHDRVTGVTECISKGANNQSESTSVNADGRFVAFSSYASNLVPGDTNWYSDIFVYDRVQKKMECVSVSSSGLRANHHSTEPSISLDARYVAFSSKARNLSDCDNDWYPDAFVHDRMAKETKCVSISSSGVNANGWCNTTAVSAGGRYAVFDSEASNLVNDDTNNVWDVFVHDNMTDVTAPSTTLSASGTQGNNGWFVSDVYITLDAVDDEGGSGVARTEYSFDGANWSIYDGAISISAEGTTTLCYRSCDNSGNMEETRERLIAVDNTKPQVLMLAPSEGAEYLLNQVVISDWSAADAVSGVATQTGTLSSGGLLDTSAVGMHSFTIRAEDNAGNIAEQTISYSVRYDLIGFSGRGVNTKNSDLKLGRAVPVKFQLLDADGYLITNATARLYIARVENDAVADELPAESTAKSSRDNAFRYDSIDEQYIFNLATGNMSQGEWQLRIELDDASSRCINITLR